MTQPKSFSKRLKEKLEPAVSHPRQNSTTHYSRFSLEAFEGLSRIHISPFKFIFSTFKITTLIWVGSSAVNWILLLGMHRQLQFKDRKSTTLGSFIWEHNQGACWIICFRIPEHLFLNKALAKERGYNKRNHRTKRKTYNQDYSTQQGSHSDSMEELKPLQTSKSWESTAPPNQLYNKC